MTQRRATDGDGDYSQLRKSAGHDSLSRWVIGLVLVAIASGLTFLLQADRTGIIAKAATAQEKADAAFVLASTSDKQIAVLASELSGIQVLLAEVRRDQKETLSRLPRR